MIYIGENLRRQSLSNRKLLLALGCILTLLSSCSYPKYKGLLTWDEYYKNSEKRPYILELTAKKGSLVYYGSLHRVDPRDLQFVDIERRWKKFKPTMVLCEGCIWPLEESRKRAITRYGEGGLLRFLAAQDRIPIQCIDPPRDKQAIYLSRFFPPEKIKIYFILRQAMINRNMNKDINNVNYVGAILRELTSLDRFKSNPYTLEEFENSVRNLFPELKKWQSIPCSYLYSNDPEDFLPQIHLKLNEFRDNHMIRILLNSLKRGKRVFAVVGRSHVVKQERVLRSEILNF